MTPQSFRDQLNNLITLTAPPRRIISLVPSQTELLFDLGLNEEIVGITKFCVHPEHWRQQKHIIGGTKNLRLDTIEKLRPDLIIANKEENDKESIEKLREKYPVWISDITSIDDALAMIRQIGELTSRISAAELIVSKIISAFQALQPFPPQRVLYLIWYNPWMAAGSGTFIDTMLRQTGLINCLADKPRYPVLSAADLRAIKPDVIFLSSEPYPFGEKHRDEIRKTLPDVKTFLVDGEMFSWYGSRLIKAPAYFNSIDLSL